MSYESNWLNSIHENIQNRDAVEYAKKEQEWFVGKTIDLLL